MERRRGPLQKWTRTPKFGKAMKCGNGGIFGVLVPYVLVYLFKHVRGNVACERCSLTERFWDAKSDEVWVWIPARESCDVWIMARTRDYRNCILTSSVLVIKIHVILRMVGRVF